MLTVDFISDIVTSMTPTITIDSVVDNGDGTQTIRDINNTILGKPKHIGKYKTFTE